MKKVISTLLAAALITGIFCVAADADTYTVTAQQSGVSVDTTNKTVDITWKLTENDGFAAAKMIVEFADENVFSFKLDDGDAVAGTTFDFGTDFSGVFHVEPNVYGATGSKATAARSVFEIDTNAGTDATATGDFFTVHLKYGDTVADGSYKVTLKVTDVTNSTGSDLTATTAEAVVEIGAKELLGDIDLNESVDINDAILLFQYSMFPDLYPIGYKGNVDFTKDSKIDINDAILLFQYSMFPDLYPIG